MRYLALDVGTRRTGIAYLDSDVGIPLPLDTIEHQTEKELLTAVEAFIESRSIDCVVVGLPLLPSGEEGEQSAVSRHVGSHLRQRGVVVEYADERYTTPQKHRGKHAIPTRNFDGDASAACALLSQKIMY